MSAATEEIRRELSAAEQLLWSGQPRQGLVVRASDAWMIPFSLVWGGFAAYWEWSVLRAERAPGFFALFGIPFLLVGVYIVVGRFFVEARQRENTLYAVTDERILIVSGLFSRRVRSLSLRTLANLTLSEKSNGEGSVSFGGASPHAYRFFPIAGWPGYEASIGPRFDLIADAKSVYALIRNAQRTDARRAD